jgi:hypothetical protein
LLTNTVSSSVFTAEAVLVETGSAGRVLATCIEADLVAIARVVGAPGAFPKKERGVARAAAEGNVVAVAL